MTTTHCGPGTRRAAEAEPAMSSSPTPSLSSALDDTAMRELLASWLRLWNGEESQVEKFIAPRFRLHAAMMDGGEDSAVDSPQALVAWIAQTRAAVPDLRFSVQVGPLVDSDHLAVRWRARGSYAGGVPGARAPIGTPVDFTGTDVLRVEHGQLAEYWVNSDTLLLLTQLRA